MKPKDTKRRATFYANFASTICKGLLITSTLKCWSQVPHVKNIHLKNTSDSYL